jgi:hypothetical protein
MKRMLSRTLAPQVVGSSSVPRCIFIQRLFQDSVITVVPVPAASLTVRSLQMTTPTGDKSSSGEVETQKKWSSASPIVECHCVHVCALADEVLHNMQVPALSCRMQCCEALSAKEMGEKGVETLRPMLK